MADNRITLPSSGGGLMRYSEEVKSRFMLKPSYILITIAIIVLIELYLYKVGL